MKTVVAVHDLSCYAKSSLTVVIPILSAMKIEVSALPTALLSTQTTGYDNYTYVDLTGELRKIIDHWKHLNLSFSGIYSGFLGSEDQIEIVEDLITWQRRLSEHPVIVVDPVLGDHGVPYGPISENLVTGMANLISHSDVITPNLTEATLLLGESYNPTISVERGIFYAKKLSMMGPRKVVITSVMAQDVGYVVGYDRTDDSSFSYKQIYAPISYPGCGDLFASMLCGFLLHGHSFPYSMETAAQLVSKAVYDSLDDSIPIEHGVSVEPLIPSLVHLV